MPRCKQTASKSARAPFVRKAKRFSNKLAATYNASHPHKDGKRPFRFLELPPELRNRIYGHFFSSEDFDDIAMWQIEVREEDEIADDIYDFCYENRSMSALLQTCNQIYLEPRTIPYNCNYIYFHKARDIVAFIGQLSTNQVHAIHNIAISFDNDETDSWSWGMLKLFPKLQVLGLIITTDLSDRIKGCLQNIDDNVSRKIKDLKGLQDLELTLDWDVASEGEKADVRRLGTLWKSVVTRSSSTT